MLVPPLTLALCAWLGTSTCAAYKILVYSPTESASHMRANGELADVLAAAGHDVTLMEVHYEVEPGTVQTAKKAKRISVDFEWENRTKGDTWPDFVRGMFSVNIITSTVGNELYHKRKEEACDTLLNASNVVDLMRAGAYDMFIGEQLDLCGTGLSRQAGIPVHVWLSSCPMPEYMASLLGLPFMPSFTPAVFQNDNVGDRMAWWGRVVNFFRSLTNYFGFYDAANRITEVFRKRWPDFPSVGEIAGQSPLVLVNTNEFLDFPRLTTARVVPIGGFGLHDEEPVGNGTRPLDAILNEETADVILFSLGSKVDTSWLPREFMDNVVQAFTDLDDYQIVAKISDNDNETRAKLAGLKHVKVMDWVPQADLLAHPQLKLFVTHAGYRSLLEAAWQGVPALCIGIFGDQMHNAELVDRNGWGRALDKRHLLDSHVPLVEAAKALIELEPYRQKAKRTMNLLRTQRPSPRDRLLNAVAFLEQNEGKLPELRPASADMSAYTLYGYDVYTTLAVVFLLLLWNVAGLLTLIGRGCQRLGERLKSVKPHEQEAALLEHHNNDSNSQHA